MSTSTTLAPRTAPAPATVIGETLRRCTVCGQSKPDRAFWRDNAVCKHCMSAPLPGASAQDANTTTATTPTRAQYVPETSSPVSTQEHDPMQQNATPAPNAAVCTTCGQSKPLSAFSTRIDRPGWRNPRCNQCVAASMRRRRPDADAPAAANTPRTGMKICRTCKRAKALAEYYRNRNTPDGYEGECKKCRYAREVRSRGNHRTARRSAPAPAKSSASTAQPDPLAALRGITIHAGERVDVRTPQPAPGAPGAPGTPGTPTQPPALPTPRAGSVTCRDWITKSPHAELTRRRLFLCASGRYAVEHVPPSGPGEAPRYLLWHLASEHRSAELAPCDAFAAVMMLSLIAPGDLDAPGTIYGA